MSPIAEELNECDKTGSDTISKNGYSAFPLKTNRTEIFDSVADTLTEFANKFHFSDCNETFDEYFVNRSITDTRSLFEKIYQDAVVYVKYMYNLVWYNLMSRSFTRHRMYSEFKTMTHFMRCVNRKIIQTSMEHTHIVKEMKYLNYDDPVVDNWNKMLSDIYLKKQFYHETYQSAMKLFNASVKRLRKIMKKEETIIRG